MVAKFTKPSGAFADVKELEYISALHQTGKNELREDGSIQAIDIVHFLMSRYGIKVTEEEVRERILNSFGNCSRRGDESRKSQIISEEFNEGDAEGGSADSGDECNTGKEEDYIDLTQVLALLLVPLLLKAQRSLKRQRKIEAQQPSLRHLSSSIEDSGTSQMAHSASSDSPFFDKDHHCEKGAKRWPDSDLMENVLQMMLHDATGDPTPRPLTKELIRQILNFYGDIADDEQLLEKMVIAASDSADKAHDVEGDPILFDHYAFAHALTHDVQQYNIDYENRVTTNYFDVFQTFYSTKEDEKKQPCLPRTHRMKTEEVGEGKGEDDVQPVQRVFTFPSIDYTADTFRSKGFVILLWVTWILSYFAYLSSSDVLSISQLNCDDTRMGCVILQGITNWLTIMAQLSILGTTFIVWASCGNSVYPASPLWVVLGMIATVLFVAVPYFRDFDAAEVVSTQKSESADKQLLYHLSLASGFILLSASLLNIVQRLHSRRSAGKHDNIFLIPGIIRLESKIKQASSYKVNRLVRNACDVHKAAEFDGGNGAGETKYGRAMLAYARKSDQTEPLGGFLETWQKVFNGNIYKDEGIWFSKHLLAGNVAQCTLCLVLVAFFVQFYRSELFQEGLKYLDALTQGSQKWRLMLSLFFGVFCGEIAIIIITINSIPSTVRTILRYRSGGYESLHNKKFQVLRCAVDNSTLLFGSIFWGTLYTSISFGFFAMLVLGIILWPDFAEIVIFLFANVIGIGITILLKWLVLIGFRRKYQKAYYRQSVGLNNFVGVILESWNLGLTTSYMVIRSFKLFIAAILFIGRVDIPFLSEEACYLGPFELDAYPLIFRKDVLAHEAHRHPYLERMGVMYMMKLRHNNFGNYAGTCWRLLFVYALLPWMRKYRNSGDKFGVSGFKFAANRMWTGRMPTKPPSNESSDAHFLELDASKEVDSTEHDGCIDELKRENQMLKKENEIMRALLYQNSSVMNKVSSSCPPRLFSNSSRDE